MISSSEHAKVIRLRERLVERGCEVLILEGTINMMKVTARKRNKKIGLLKAQCRKYKLESTKRNAEYSQGLCSDGAAILKDGQKMTIEQILLELRDPGHGR